MKPEIHRKTLSQTKRRRRQDRVLAKMPFVGYGLLARVKVTLDWSMSCSVLQGDLNKYCPGTRETTIGLGHGLTMWWHVYRLLSLGVALPCGGMFIDFCPSWSPGSLQVEGSDIETTGCLFQRPRHCGGQ